MRIGARVKAVRQKRRMTLRELSEASGLSTAFLSNLERDITSPTLDNLVKIGTALRVEMGALLCEQKQPHVVRRENRKLLFRGELGILCESITDGGGPVQGVCVTIPENQRRGELVWGYAEDVLCIVISGGLTLSIEEKSYALYAGDTLYIPKGVSREFSRNCPGECVSYWVAYAADGME